MSVSRSLLMKGARLMVASLESVDAVIDLTQHQPGSSLESDFKLQRRLKKVIDAALQEIWNGRNATDLADASAITIRVTLDEPSFAYDFSKGNRRTVFIGNPRYNVGDRIPKPAGGGGQGGGGGVAGLGEKAEDEYEFILDKDEIERRLFDHLKLPDMTRKQLTMITDTSYVRGGLRTEGQAAMLSLQRTMRNSLARRQALRRPSQDELDEVLALIHEQEGNGLDVEALKEMLAHLERRREFVPFVDTRDRRYHRVNEEEERISQAVIFNLMDVSGSMSELQKRLAKQFFWLLRRFLKSRAEYKHIDLVFIRHTDTAQEVTEEKFFKDRETGGTVVSSALEKMLEIVHTRYPKHLWNFYCCQATDGDTWMNHKGEDDATTSATIILEQVLPMFQYYAYIETWPEAPTGGKKRAEITTRLWEAYGQLIGPQRNFQMKRVWEPGQIYPVFAQLFQDKSSSVRRKVSA